MQFTEDIMSAQSIYDFVPLGSIVRYSDGTPRPPDRHRNKLSAWEDRNNGGRLVRKEPEHRVGNAIIPASITLHKGDYGSHEVVVLRVFQTFSVESVLTFTVIERPPLGSVLVLDRPGERAQLVHVAAHRQAAEAWLQNHGFPNAVLREVSADNLAVDVVEGRVA
jgi:hypothetical protein